MAHCKPERGTVHPCTSSGKLTVWLTGFLTRRLWSEMPKCPRLPAPFSHKEQLVQDIVHIQTGNILETRRGQSGAKALTCPLSSFSSLLELLCPHLPFHFRQPGQNALGWQTARFQGSRTVPMVPFRFVFGSQSRPPKRGPSLCCGDQHR